jgi:hypothetical protein
MPTIKTTRTGTTTSPKLEPVIPRQVSARGAPLPFKHTQAVPKASLVNNEPTTEEWAAFGRSVYQARLELVELKVKTVEKHRQIDELFNGMRNRRAPSTIEECSNCHGRHEGPCNA